MSRRLPSVALLSIVCVMVLSPAVGSAQSAGDNQYADPLAATSTASTHAATVPATKTTSVTKAPPVKLPTATTKATTTTTSTTKTTTSATKSSGSLPRTGLDEWVLAALAAAMLLAGFGLRLRTAGVPRR